MMKKKCYIFIITLFVVCCIVGCEKTEINEIKYEEQDMNQEKNKDENNKELTREGKLRKYGILKLYQTDLHHVYTL